MLGFKVHRFAARSGIEETVLTDRAGMPWFWPNVFVTSEYRNASKSPNTRAKILRTLGMAVFWARSQGRDIDEDLTLGNFLSMADVEDLADYLSLTAEEQERRGGLSAELSPSKIISLEAFRPDHRHLEVKRAEVDNAEIATRVRWAALYIEWHLNRRTGSLDRHRAAAESLSTIGPKVVARLRQLAPRVPSVSDDEITLEGVDFEVLRRAEEAMRPGSRDNPFTFDFVQARNYLIWRLLVDTGARRGEVSAAKVDDVKYSLRRFEIRVSKTIARTVPISAKTADVFDVFVERFWSQLPRDARNRQYLFTDEKGNSLSLKAINRIFERLRKRVPGIPDFMTPHTVRRTWNDRFSAQIDAMPADQRPSQEQEIQTRNRLQGWSGKSSTGNRYAKRHIRRKADQVAEAMMSFPSNEASDKKNE